MVVMISTDRLMSGLLLVESNHPGYEHAVQNIPSNSLKKPSDNTDARNCVMSCLADDAIRVIDKVHKAIDTRNFKRIFYALCNLLLQGKLGNIWPPEMLLRIYSLCILMLDLAMLFIGVSCTILIAIYRMFRPPPLKNLNHEVAMVVGAGRGIGKELTLQLCQFGVTVACVDINASACSDTVERAQQLYGACRSYQCDVRDKDMVAQTVNLIKNELGDITMLFHCCGLPSPRALVQESSKVRDIMDLSVISHFWLLDSVLPCMRRAHKGHITILSSVAGLSNGSSGRGTRVPLSTAQFGIQGLAESLHMELRHSNSDIIVSLVHIYPFIVGTEIANDIRFRLPSYFGTMPAAEAARQILDGVRRNYAEFSVPGYLLYLGHVLRILPKKASFMLRDLLDTGVDFA